MADTRITIDKNFTKLFTKTIEGVFSRFKFSYKKVKDAIQPLDSVYIYEYEINSGGVPLKAMINLVGVEDSGWILSVLIKGKDITTFKNKEEINNEIPSQKEFIKTLESVVQDIIENIQKKYGLPLIKRSSRKVIISSADITNTNVVQLIVKKVAEGYKTGNIIDDIIIAVDDSEITSEIFARIPLAIESYRKNINDALSHIASELNQYEIE